MAQDWNNDLEPLLKQYKNRKHPLDYNNRYQLLVMVVLSAQATDDLINKIAKDFFIAYPTIADLGKATPEEVHKLVKSVRSFGKKTTWLLQIAEMIGTDDKIPTRMDELIKFPGLGRKSANVIIRELKGTAEGIIVDLHVVRVAPRLGIASGDKPEQIEKQMMSALDKNLWGDAGMSISFLGREICRPTPDCLNCIMTKVCKFYQEVVKK